MPTPQRIVILGRSGGGKSTLARALGARLDLPVIHIDSLFWKPGWTTGPKEEFRRDLAAALAGDRWITDGNFSNTFHLRLPRADLIIWVEQPRHLCIRRALLRVWRHHGRSRPDLAPGCPERLDWEFLRYIWNFDRDTKPKIMEGIREHGRGVPLVTLRGDGEVGRFAETFPDHADFTPVPSGADDTSAQRKA